MENVFVAIVTYPFSGNEETIEVFDTLEVAREWVVEGIKRYLAEVVADANDTYHSQEWRANVQEGIEECEKYGYVDDNAYACLVQDFDELDRQYECYSIRTKQVQSKA